MSSLLISITQKNTLATLISVACFVISISIASWIVVKEATTMPGDCDEVYYYQWTEFFDVVFLHHPTRPDLWSSIEAFDHPNLSKYLYGANLYLHDKAYSEKRERLNMLYGPGCKVTPNKEFMESIMIMRQVTVLATIATLFFIALVVWVLTHSLIISGFSVVLLVRDHLFLIPMIRADSSGILTLFMLASLSFYLLYLNYKNAFLFILFVISAGLSISTKLTGVLLFPIVILYGFCQVIFRMNTWRRTGLEVFLFVILSGSVWVIHSPNLMQAPWNNTLRFIETRQEMITRQSSKDRTDSMKTLSSRIRVGYCLFFQTRCLNPSESINLYNGELTQWSVINVSLFLIGFATLLKIIFKTKSQTHFFFILYSIVSIILITFINPLAWDRYYLPVTIPIHIIQLVGVWGIMIVCRKKFSDLLRGVV